ncbi:MAG: sulfate ABC transporter permease subunit CysW [Gemmataceae bacterium]
MGNKTIITASLKKKRPEDSEWVRYLLTTMALGVVFLIIGIPVFHVFFRAFEKGPMVYLDNLFGNPNTRHSIFLTLSIAPRVVFLSVVFGVSAAWAIARFRFPGRTILLTLMDLPLAVSPVVAGLVFVLIFGMQGWMGEWLSANNMQILFGTPSLVLATCFVTLPYVVRELIPVLETYGEEEELAAVSLGANGWQMFWRITMPNIRLALVYGIILCNARAMGEFGAVYVVSGRISGLNDTMPLRVEKLFQEYDMPAAFALASVLTFLALVTLGVKTYLEKSMAHQKADAGEST